MTRSGPRPLAMLRKICLSLPESHERLSHGEPAFFVKKKMFGMFADAGNHHGRGRHAAWIKAAPGRQARAVKSAPDRFFVPPYVGPSGWVGVYLDANTDWKELADILRDAYRQVAPKKLIAKAIVAIAIVIAGGCDRQTPSGPSNGGVSGRVLDFTSGVGVSGATVTFGDMTATTGASGTYTFDNLPSGLYEPRVDGAWMGLSRVTGSSYRGDLFARPGTCVARYGTLADAHSRRPVVGAIVRLSGQEAISERDGWYRIDLGCPANGLIGFNTTILTVSHSSYADASQVVGRGIAGATRLDLDLEPR